MFIAQFDIGSSWLFVILIIYIPKRFIFNYLSPRISSKIIYLDIVFIWLLTSSSNSMWMQNTKYWKSLRIKYNTQPYTTVYIIQGQKGQKRQGAREYFFLRILIKSVFLTVTSLKQQWPPPKQQWPPLKQQWPPPKQQWPPTKHSTVPFLYHWRNETMSVFIEEGLSLLVRWDLFVFKLSLDEISYKIYLTF